MTSYNAENVRERLASCTPTYKRSHSVSVDRASLGDIGASNEMTNLTRDEISQLLASIESRMDSRLDRMEKETDRRSQDVRRELELRDEAFRREQAARNDALDQRFAGFLAVQTERDKRLDQVVSSIGGEINTVRTEVSRLGSLKLNIWGAMATALTIGIAIAALSIGFYQTGKSDTPTREQVSPAQQIPAPAPSPQPDAAKQ